MYGYFIFGYVCCTNLLTNFLFYDSHQLQMVNLIFINFCCEKLMIV
jgi:hypothetical protein